MKILNPPPTADEPWYQTRGVAFNIQLKQEVVWNVATIPGRYKWHRQA